MKNNIPNYPTGTMIFVSGLIYRNNSGDRFPVAGVSYNYGQWKALFWDDYLIRYIPLHLDRYNTLEVAK